MLSSQDERVGSRRGSVNKINSKLLLSNGHAALLVSLLTLTQVEGNGPTFDYCTIQVIRYGYASWHSTLSTTINTLRRWDMSLEQITELSKDISTLEISEKEKEKRREFQRVKLI